ncbi:hypothetical protein FPOAC2_13004 [Fusarium poae]|jgi:hypothetical protein|uniref:Uncharacterized protein n=1 Tax=Fusarium poae TaxID=36050 RepID=A0A1B8AI35_FUSPO|nr:hypothetical protein FPOAC1_012645 [Fusarium poae]KAG8667806.1 hypothetical protein FPOAC1_012645 [Fusarium poae]OBS20036.1 hypothetical protein FPOA_11757 [Fusarium poae]
MPVIITIKYRVREDVLKQFLEEHLGKSPTDTGIVLWYYEPASGTTNIGWQLTADRHLTDDEKHKLRLLSQPPPSPLFG